MIKRFFRDLKVPLFPNATLRKTLLELAKKNEEAPITFHDLSSVFGLGDEVAKKSFAPFSARCTHRYSWISHETIAMGNHVLDITSR
ncbi:hypothetical protein OSTOST_14929 [Ostertagia ostertagi]